MAKAIFANEKQLEEAKQKMRGTISYRQMKDGRVIAVKWPKQKRKK